MTGARDQLMDATEHLICHHGVHATGVDDIVARSGVSKMTLYRLFGSKDELVAATLERKDARFCARLEECIARRSTPKGRLFAVFDVLSEWLKANMDKGCSFVAVASEFPETDHPVRQAAKRHKARVIAILKRLCVDANVKNPGRLSNELFILMEGAFAANSLAPHVLRDIPAKRLIELSLPN